MAAKECSESNVRNGSFFAADYCAELVPNAIGFINDVVSIFGGSFYVAFLSNLISAAVAALNIIEKLLIIGLGVKALTQGTIAVPVVDNLINKYMG